MRSTNFGGMNRRNFLKAAAATGITGGLAGCADNTEPEPEPTNKTNETEDTTQQKEDQGLQLDFTWNDILQAEINHYKSSAKHHGIDENAAKIVDPTYIQNSDLTNYNDFQTALIETITEAVAYLGEQTSSDSSVMTSEAAAGINLAIQEELENNEIYQEEGLQIKMMPLGNDGHGYTQVASTHHPLTTVDSNAKAVGQPHERPLEKQRNVEIRDPISRFIDKDFHEVDEFDQGSYQGIVLGTYSKGTDSSRNIGIDSEVIDEYHDEVIFGDERELIFDAIRPAIGTMRMLLDENHTDKEALMIESSPSKLPKLNEYDDFDQYTQELWENHLEKYDDRDELIEQAFNP